jgi:hypothetical protein
MNFLLPERGTGSGPGWTGVLPEGVKEYQSSTSFVCVLGRICCPECLRIIFGNAYSPPGRRRAQRKPVQSCDVVIFLNKSQAWFSL